MRYLLRSCAFLVDTRGVVADGGGRLRAGIEAEARAEVERKYAREWNEAGWLKRWSLRRRMDREIAVIVAARSQEVSAHTMF